MVGECVYVLRNRVEWSVGEPVVGGAATLVGGYGVGGAAAGGVVAVWLLKVETETCA